MYVNRFFLYWKFWSFLNFKYFGSEKQLVCGRSFDLASIVFLYNTSWKSIETVRSLSGSLVFFVNVELEPEKILEFLRILLFHMQTWNQGDDTCVFVPYVWHNTGELVTLTTKHAATPVKVMRMYIQPLTCNVIFWRCPYYFYRSFIYLQCQSMYLTIIYRVKNNERCLKTGQ